MPTEDPVVVIAHDPANIPETPEKFLMNLAGPTHGGQVNLPLIGAPLFPGGAPRHYAFGRIEESDKKLYVTSGIGTSILPIRFNMPPEIVFMTVKK